MIISSKNTLLAGVALVLSMGFTACNSPAPEGTTDATATESPAIVRVTLPENVKASTSDLLDGYYGLKDAMVTSEHATVKTSAEALLDQISRFDTEGMEPGDTANIINLIEAIRFGTQNVSEAATIDAQREYLPALTENMIALVKGYTVTDAAVYKQYCPMAFNDTGAAWLSSSDQVLNPYFGDAMLRCGTVQETL